jgi:hypothetical protein
MLARRLAIAALAPASAACLALGADALLKRQVESEAAAYIAAALILGAGAALMGLEPRSQIPTRVSRHFGLIVALLWLAMAVIPAATFAPNGWDEGTYLLSGLAIRGYPTPYAPHRPPVTGLLCALFAGSPRWINPLLVLLLSGVVASWARALWSWRDAAWVLLILGCQNLMVAMAVDVMPELPAAIAFTVAFYLLSRRSPFLSGVALGVSALARWNMAVAIPPVILVVGLRSGVAAAARLTAGCALPVSIWYGATAAAGYAPVASVLAHFYKARAFAQNGGQVPDFLLRSREYFPRFLLLTPLGLLSLLWSPFLPVTPGQESLRWHAPTGVLAVVLSLLFVGAIEPRFFAPVLPLTALILWRVLRQLLSTSSMPGSLAPLARHLAVIVTCAIGVWPGHAAVYIAQNLAYEPPFSPSFMAAATQALGPDEQVAAAASPPLTSNGGHHVMYWLRRTVTFPAAARDEWDGILAQPDERRAACSLLAAVPLGTAVVIPRRGCGHGPTCCIDLITADRNWLLGRSAGPCPLCRSEHDRSDATRSRPHRDLDAPRPLAFH